jgi:hypothetical protein
LPTAETKAAENFAPLPSGEYVARIVGGELFTSKSKGTAGYKLAFRVLEGDYQGRQFWHDGWLTPAALSMAKRRRSTGEARRPCCRRTRRRWYRYHGGPSGPGTLEKPCKCGSREFIDVAISRRPKPRYGWCSIETRKTARPERRKVT